MVLIVETLAKLKPKMSGRNLDMIRRTSFTLLVEIEAILQERGLLDVLMQRYDNRSQKFRIGESLLSFRPEDVIIILGL